MHRRHYRTGRHAAPPLGRAGFTVLALTALITVVALVALAAFTAAWQWQYRPPQAAGDASARAGQGPADFGAAPAVADHLDWPSVGGDAGHQRFSPLAQITPGNVARLQQAWSYRTGEVERRGPWGRQGKVQATPILAGGSLVFCTPFSRAIALDPATGEERWIHDPGLGDIRRRPGERFNCRGLARWQDATVPAGMPCAERLFLPTTDRRLVALDARDGRPCDAFGDHGTVRVAIGRAGIEEGELQFASAPAVAGDVVVIGTASGDNQRAAGIPGTVHAFDARTGAARWTFDPIAEGTGPSPASGQANVWGSISVDEARGMVFLPTSSPSPDYYGGARPGDNRLANSVVALEAATGRVAWHFQTVHHDLWDYDVPAAPSLFDWRGADGRPVPALAFATKTGFVFVLDRLTGQPLTAVEERPVPASRMPDERSSPTQPFSTGQPVLVAQRLSPDDAFGVLGFDRLACRDAIAAAGGGELFRPPSLDATLMMPMGGGGANWGGVAVDPAVNRLFVNVNQAVHRITLLPAAEAARLKAAEPKADIGLMAGAPYGMRREVLLSPLGLPCNKPPWGMLAAVDLQSGRLAWRVPLGNSRKLAPLGLSFDWGTPTFGGPIVTAGGVLFIGSTMDALLRAFDPASGRLLWAGELPYSAMATPMTYATGGRQYVVIAAGGHPVLGAPIGDALVAFALPQP